MKTSAASSGSTIANSTTLCPCSLRCSRVNKPTGPPVCPEALSQTAKLYASVWFGSFAIAAALASRVLDVVRQVPKISADLGDEVHDLALEHDQDSRKRDS